MITFRRLACTAACISLAALAGCASSASRVAVKPVVEPGVYTVRANAEGVELRGFMQVVADTVTLELERTDCVRDPLDHSTVTLKYRCDPVGDITNIVFYVDRRNPVQSSRWNAETIQRTTRQVCSAVLVNGREVRSCQEMPTMASKLVAGDLVVSREVARAK